MTAYRISVDVEATTVKTTEMVVEAESPDEAQEIARVFLQVFPSPTSNDAVTRAVVSKTANTAPASLTFLAIKPVQMLHPQTLS